MRAITPVTKTRCRFAAPCDHSASICTIHFAAKCATFVFHLQILDTPGTPLNFPKLALYPDLMPHCVSAQRVCGIAILLQTLCAINTMYFLFLFLYRCLHLPDRARGGRGRSNAPGLRRSEHDRGSVRRRRRSHIPQILSHITSIVLCTHLPHSKTFGTLIYGGPV